MEKKATKVVFDGSWELEPEHEKEETLIYTDEDGLEHEQRVYKTVEAVVIFAPKNEDEATAIARFLIERADATKPNAIEQSWYVPDIRATMSLSQILMRGNDSFKVVVSNIYERGKTRLLALKKETKFSVKQGLSGIRQGEWDSENSTQNTRLVEFLSNGEVLP